MIVHLKQENHTKDNQRTLRMNEFFGNLNDSNTVNIFSSIFWFILVYVKAKSSREKKI